MNNATRQRGKWLPGFSGNPNGRPKAATTELRRQLAAQGAEVAGKVIAAALGGDMGAARLVLERLSPALKPTTAPVNIDIAPGASPADAGRAIVAAAASGQMPADVAATLLHAVADLAKLIEAGELQARIERLEEAINGQDN